MNDEKILDQELRKLWTAWGHLRQQIHAAEETFSNIPSTYKVDRLAQRRHELHLIELDIAEFDDKLVDLRKRRQDFARALRELPKIKEA